MLGFVVQRLLATIPVLGMVAVFVFLMLRLTPGDPAAIIAGDNATAAQIAEIRDKLAESAERDGVIRLADILKEREEARAETDTNGNGSDPAEGEDETVPSEEEHSAQLDEALEVLTDLIVLTRHES